MDYVLFQKDQGYSFDVPIDHIRFLKDFDVIVKAEEKEKHKDCRDLGICKTIYSAHVLGGGFVC